MYGKLVGNFRNGRAAARGFSPTAVARHSKFEIPFFSSSESHPEDLLIFTDFGVSQAVLFFVSRSLQVSIVRLLIPKTRVF